MFTDFVLWFAFGLQNLAYHDTAYSDSLFSWSRCRFSFELFSKEKDIEYWVFGIYEKLRTTCEINEPLLRKIYALGYRYILVIRKHIACFEKNEQAEIYIQSLGNKLAVGDSIGRQLFNIEYIYDKTDRFAVEFPFYDGTTLLPIPFCPPEK